MVTHTCKVRVQYVCGAGKAVKHVCSMGTVQLRVSHWTNWSRVRVRVRVRVRIRVRNRVRNRVRTFF